MREENGVPILPLPLCAPAIHIKQFNKKHFRSRPDASNIQLNWQSPQGKCLWNCPTTLLLAQEYLELYREGKIKLKHHILPYNSKVDLKTVQKTLQMRLFCTQTYWKNENLPDNNSSPHSDDDDDTTAIP